MARTIRSSSTTLTHRCSTLARRSPIARPQVRLWPWPVWRLYRPSRWGGGTVLRDPGIRCGGVADHDVGRPRHSRPAEPCTSRVHRRTGRAMRILHQRHDHGCHRAVVAFSTSTRKRNTRGTRSESLPVWQPCAGDRRGAAGGERGLSHDPDHPPFAHARRRRARRRLLLAARGGGE